MIEIYEFSIRKRVEFDELRTTLAEALGIDQSQIVPESSFWDSLESNQPKVVGLVVYHSDLGFRTLCKWRQTWTLRDIELLQLGSFASVCFNTEVAIGNIQKSVTFMIDVLSGELKLEGAVHTHDLPAEEEAAG